MQSNALPGFGQGIVFFLFYDDLEVIFLAAAEEKFCVISAGHFETESESFHMLLDELKNKFPDVEFVWGGQQNPVLAV